MCGIRYAWAMAAFALCGMVATAGWGEVITTGDTEDDGSYFYAGYHTIGDLWIDAGSVFSRLYGCLGYATGSTGSAVITGAGSMWLTSNSLYVGYSGSGRLMVFGGGLVSAQTLYASLSDLYGSGWITARGGVLDADLSFDKTHGLTQTLAFGSGGTLQFTIDARSNLGIGYKQSGSLRIADGRSVASTTGFLGYHFHSSGAATVTGAGSKWTNSDNLYIGKDGRGTLAVSDGGQVTARDLNINSQSTVRAHVSGDRMLVLMAGHISNDGKLSLLADAFLPGGTYRPIVEYADRAVSWSGSGSTAAVGGIWDGGAGTFTVSDPVLVEAGAAAEVGGGMRLLISDGGSGERAGVSFGELTSGTTLTSLPLTESERAGLLLLLGSQEMMLSGWDFAGELAGGEALVSFDVGMGAEEVRVWKLGQEGWSEYAPEMVTYDAKGIVSFTVDPAALNGSGYAVSGVVPEPMGMGMLMVAAGMGLVRRRRMAVAAK